MLGDQTATFTLTDVAFVRHDEAIIEFAIRLSGGSGFRRRVERCVVASVGW